METFFFQRGHVKSCSKEAANTMQVWDCHEDLTGTVTSWHEMPITVFMSNKTQIIQHHRLNIWIQVHNLYFFLKIYSDSLVRLTQIFLHQHHLSYIQNVFFHFILTWCCSLLLIFYFIRCCSIWRKKLLREAEMLGAKTTIKEKKARCFMISF